MHLSIATLVSIVLGLTATVAIAGPCAGHRWPLEGSQDYLPDNPERIGKRGNIRDPADVQEARRSQAPIVEVQQQ